MIVRFPVGGNAIAVCGVLCVFAVIYTADVLSVPNVSVPKLTIHSMVTRA